MLENIKALLFDLDGTLVDSMGVWKEIDIEYLGKFGIPLPDDLQKCLEGLCFHDTAIYVKNRFSIPDSLEEMENTWNVMAHQKYSHSIRLKPGAFELLKWAKENDIKTGIATSNSRFLLDAFLEGNSLFDYFDFTLAGCDTLKSKPDPEIYLTLADKLSVVPSQCLVFEDIPKGLLAGKNAGMKVCAVDDIYSAYAIEEKKRIADYYIYSYLDIFDK